MWKAPLNMLSIFSYLCWSRTICTKAILNFLFQPCFDFKDLTFSLQSLLSFFILKWPAAIWAFQLTHLPRYMTCQFFAKSFYRFFPKSTRSLTCFRFRFCIPLWRKFILKCFKRICKERKKERKKEKERLKERKKEKERLKEGEGNEEQRTRCCYLHLPTYVNEEEL